MRHGRAAMSGYWIYEDMIVHTAVLYRAECR
jgi:hypothetical protein